MKEEIKTINQAVEFLETIGIDVDDVSHYKYKVYDNDFSDFVETDKDLIDYANEQQEALEI